MPSVNVNASYQTRSSAALPPAGTPDPRWRAGLRHPKNQTLKRPAARKLYMSVCGCKQASESTLAREIGPRPPGASDCTCAWESVCVPRCDETPAAASDSAP